MRHREVENVNWIVSTLIFIETIHLAAALSSIYAFDQSTLTKKKTKKKEKASPNLYHVLSYFNRFRLKPASNRKFSDLFVCWITEPDVRAQLN